MRHTVFYSTLLYCKCGTCCVTCLAEICACSVLYAGASGNQEDGGEQEGVRDEARRVRAPARPPRCSHQGAPALPCPPPAPTAPPRPCPYCPAPGSSTAVLFLYTYTSVHIRIWNRKRCSCLTIFMCLLWCSFNCTVCYTATRVNYGYLIL